MFDLASNPFFWQGVVFSLFGFVIGLACHAAIGFPTRLVESM